MKEQFIHIDSDGNKFYYKDREMTILHREDGPAIEYRKEAIEWWLNGKRLSEEEFNVLMEPNEPTKDVSEM